LKRNRILISPNSFKECADSVTIAELVRDELKILKNVDLITKPVSDGGDGFLNVCKFYVGGEVRYYNIVTAYDESTFECPVLYSENRKEIYIESALVLGLMVVPITFRNPLKLTSKGLGELLVEINNDVKRGRIKVENVFIGIGGTATIDMGMGMMSELGLKLFDSENKEITMLPENFLNIQEIRYEPINFPFNLICIIDVTNPLIGYNNGIEIFGRQKGAEKKIIFQLIKSFNHLIKLFEYKNLIENTKSLSGAGGGIPAAFQIFYKISPCSSSSFLERNLGFGDYVNKVDYLITGEGAYDHQSRFGKGVSVLLELLHSKVEKIFLVCGKISDESFAKLPQNVYPIELNKYFSSQNEAINNYKNGLNKACQEIIEQLNF
jgi:glycerate 2-kinase